MGGDVATAEELKRSRGATVPDGSGLTSAGRSPETWTLKKSAVKRERRISVHSAKLETKGKNDTKKHSLMFPMGANRLRAGAYGQRRCSARIGLSPEGWPLTKPR